MKIMLVAAEPSADLHAGRLIEELKEQTSGAVTVYGVGGDRVRKAGGEVVYDLASLSTYGIVEVFSSIPALFKSFFGLVCSVRREKPDAVVLIDYPDFNIRLARILRWVYGKPLKIIYYICPQVWIWRKGRVKKIARLVDKILAVFPFEKGLYGEYGADVEFVGHPLVESVPLLSDGENYKERYSVGENEKLIAFLPGSRTKEIEAYMPSFIEAAGILNKDERKYRFIVALAPNLDRNILDIYLDGAGVDIQVVHGETHEVVEASDIAVVAFGTATLETALLGKPMVMVGKVSPLTGWIGRKVFRIDAPFYGLANWVLEKKDFPELVQEDCTPERIVEEVEKLFKNHKDYEGLVKSARHTRTILGDTGASANAARAILRCIEEKEWINRDQKKLPE